METQSVIHRKGFGLKEEVGESIANQYRSNLIDYFRANGNEIQAAELHIFMAAELGFCHGVARAIEFAYETVRKFPDRKIYLIGEIVHNSFVNRQLQKSGIEIVRAQNQDEMDFSFIQPQDVVILPAFGVTSAAFLRLKQIGCEIVDTTCGSVLSVWKRVEQYARDGFTTIIHGEYPHEETTAICSQTAKYPGRKYLIVRNKKEAAMVSSFLDGKLAASDLLKRLGHKASPGFDPNFDLAKIGLANQTTMLGLESLEIAGMIAKGLQRKFGKMESNLRFRNFDTICSATQDRQQALQKLLSGQKLDILLVVGGFNSNNTGHLVEIGANQLPTYHVQDVIDLTSEEEIRHKTSKGIVTTRNWLPVGKARVGITAGASTPNKKIEQIIRRLFALKRLPDFEIKKLLTANQAVTSIQEV